MIHMLPLFPALPEAIIAALLAIGLYALVSRSREESKKIFKQEIVGALATFQLELRDKVLRQQIMDALGTWEINFHTRLDASRDKFFNGRYLLKNDFTTFDNKVDQKFSNIEQKLDRTTEILHSRVSAASDEMRDDIKDLPCKQGKVCHVDRD